MRSLVLLQYCHSKNFQSAKFDSALSSWFKILVEVLQGSIWSTELYQKVLKDLVLFNEKTDIYDFADVNAWYSYLKFFNNVLEKVDYDLKVIFKMIQR